MRRERRDVIGRAREVEMDTDGKFVMTGKQGNFSTWRDDHGFEIEKSMTQMEERTSSISRKLYFSLLSSFFMIISTFCIAIAHVPEEPPANRQYAITSADNTRHHTDSTTGSKKP